MKTGDILLCDNHPSNPINPIGFFDSIIRMFTRSTYVHVAMVLVNPVYIDPKLQGVYVWESGWEGTPDAEDGQVKFGVQITPIENLLSSEGKIWIRTLEGISLDESKLKQVHDIVKNKPYDIVPLDWLEAVIQKDINKQKIDRFWCSALMGYIYSQTGVLTPNTDWSILRPCDFSMDMEHLTCCENVSFGTQKAIK